MGRFSTTVHIKNGLGAAKFINSFCEVMEKRGFVKCTEDECALSYFMAFSNGGWVTLSSDKYSDDPRKAKDDVQQIAEGMKTAAFSVEVVDSDFAILTLNDGDSIIVGDGSGYGFEDAPKGERSKWELLLAEGKTWEQLAECRDKSEVFVEDALWEAAPILGIEPEYICADFEELSGKAEGSKNISTLYFKKADSKGKAMSLNAAFNKVFGEGLEPLGFKKIKGRQPYFVRVVPGGEIIHVISIKKGFAYKHAVGREAFEILCGAATVYRPKIDLSKSPRDNTWWLSDIKRIYIGTNRFDYDSDLANNLSEMSFILNDRKSQLEAMNFALEHTKNIVIPVFDRTVDFDSFARFWVMMRDGLNPERHFEAVKGGELNPNRIHDEGLVLIKVKDYPSYVDWSTERRRILNSRCVEDTFDKYSEEDYKDFCSKIDETKRQQIAKMSEIKNDTHFYNLIELEFERRRRLNTETLRSYGIDI